MYYPYGIGGILVLMLFAVMLTHRVADVCISNRAIGRWPTLLVIAVVGAFMGRALAITNWHQIDPATPAATTYGIGDGLLRISVGLEAVSDLQADLSRGLG